MKSLQRYLEDPVRMRLLNRWFYAGLAALALSEAVAPRLFHTQPGDFWFEDIPAWGSVCGLVSCVVIIVVSKLLGRLVLMRRENYYDS